jgi:hypothetical protein
MTGKAHITGSTGLAAALVRLAVGHTDERKRCRIETTAVYAGEARAGRQSRRYTRSDSPVVG